MRNSVLFSSLFFVLSLGFAESHARADCNPSQTTTPLGEIRQSVEELQTLSACSDWIDTSSRKSVIGEKYAQAKACLCGTVFGAKEGLLMWPRFVKAVATAPIETTESALHETWSGAKVVYQFLAHDPSEVEIGSSEIARAIYNASWLNPTEKSASYCEAIVEWVGGGFGIPAAAAIGVKKAFIAKTAGKGALITESEQRLVISEKLLGRDLDEQQKNAITQAHSIGLTDAKLKGVEKYTSEELRAKAKALRDAGFSIEEIDTLMRSGVAGLGIELLTIYGAFSLGKDVYDLIGGGTRSSSFERRYSSKDPNEASFGGHVLRTTTAFDETFKNFIPTTEVLSDYSHISPQLGEPLKRAQLPGVAPRELQQVANEEIRYFKTKSSRNEVTAFLVKSENGSHELVVGKLTPITTTISRSFSNETTSITLLNGFKVETSTGIRTIDVKDILRFTGRDLRDRTPLFHQDFKDFRPTLNWKEDDLGLHASKLGSAAQAIAKESLVLDDESVITGNLIKRAPDRRKIEEIRIQAQQEISYFKGRSAKGEELAFLIKNADGSQKLVLGKVEPRVKTVSRDVETYYKGERPKSEPVSIEVLEGFDIQTPEGIQHVSVENILSFTKADLRDRQGLFTREFRDFSPTTTLRESYWDTGFKPGSAEQDFLERKLTTSVLSPILERHLGTKVNNEALAEIGRKAKREIDYFAAKSKKKEVTAFLVRLEDGSQQLLIGQQKPIVQTLTREVEISEKNLSPRKVPVSVDVLKGLSIETPTGVREISSNQIVSFTETSVQNYSGYDMRLLKMHIDKTGAPVKELRKLSPLELKDLAKANPNTPILKKVAELQLAHKVEFVKFLIGRDLTAAEVEGLSHAIFTGKTGATQENGFTQAETLSRMRILKQAGFSESERANIIRSGVLGRTHTKGRAAD